MWFAKFWRRRVKHNAMSGKFGMKTMTAGKTLFYFSFWVFACALGLLFVPGIMLSLLGMSTENSIIARIFGMVLLFLAYYYMRAGADGTLTKFYRWTTHTRLLAFPISAVFVALKMISPLLLLFVLVDVAGALWTLSALRRQR